MATAGRSARAAAIFCAAAILLGALGLSGCVTTGATRGNDLALEPVARQAAEARVHWAAGYRALRANNRSQAIEEFARAAELDPKNLSLQQNVGAIYEQTENWKQAAIVWERATQAHPESFESWQQLTEAYRKTDQLDKAIAAALHARRLEPTQPRSYATLADLYWQKKKYRDAIKILEEGTHLNDKSVELWLALGKVSLRHNPEHPDQLMAAETARLALERVQTLALKGSEAAQYATLMLGVLHARMGEFERALAQGSLLNRFPLEIAQQIFEEARQRPPADRRRVAELVNAAIKQQTLQPRLYNLFADLCELTDDHERAARALRESLILDDGQLEVYSDLAMIYARQKNREEVAATIARAKAKFPNDPRVSSFKGMAYVAMKGYTEALAAFAAAESGGILNKEYERARALFEFEYGEACERAGKRDEAEAHFRQAIVAAGNPGRERLLAQSLNYLGYMLADANQKLDEALDLIQKAVKLEPNNSAYLDSLGWVHFRLGRYNEALKELTHAVKLTTEGAARNHRPLTDEDAVGFDHVAQAYQKLGRLDEAIAQWQRALKLDPANKDYVQRLQHAQSAKTSRRSPSSK